MKTKDKRASLPPLNTCLEFYLLKVLYFARDGLTRTDLWSKDTAATILFKGKKKKPIDIFHDQFPFDDGYKQESGMSWVLDWDKIKNPYDKLKRLEMIEESEEKSFITKRGRDYFSVDRFSGSDSKITDVSTAEQLARFLQQLKEWAREDLQASDSNVFIPHPYSESSNFTGRLQEKKELNLWFSEESDQPLLVIVAPGGMGKSALVWTWLKDSGLLADANVPSLKGVIYWSFYGEEFSFERFLNYCAERVMKIPLKKEEPLYEKLDSVYTYLQRHRFLLIFDGIERMLNHYAGLGSPYQTEIQDEDYSEEFDFFVSPSFARFIKQLASDLTLTKTVLTTRIFPRELSQKKGIKKIELGEINLPDAVEFFTREGLKGTRFEFEQAASSCGCHPLYLRILSGMIKCDKQNPNDIKKWGEKNPLPLLLGENQKHHILETAYNRLDKNQKELIGKLSAFRYWVSYSVVAKVSNPAEESSLQQSIDSLERRGLLFQSIDEVDHSTKYDMHPIIRQYCYSRLTEPEEIHEILREFFFSLPRPKGPKRVEDLAPLIELFHHTTKAGRIEDAHVLLMKWLWDILYYIFSEYQLLIHLGESLFSKDGILLVESKAEQARIYNSLGTCYAITGRVRKAARMFSRAIKLAEELNQKKQIIVGSCNMASMALVSLGNLQAAEENFQRSISLAKEISHKPSEAICLEHFGYLQAYTEPTRIALETEKRAQDLMDSLWNSGERQSGVFSTRAFVAQIHLLQGNYMQALHCFTEALKYLDIFKAAVTTNLKLEVQASLIGGTILLELGEMEQSEAFLDNAITICRAMDIIEKEAPILLSYAKLFNVQKRYKECIEYAEEALQISQRFSFILQEAEIHLFLANFYDDRGEISKAKDHAQLAKLCSHQMIDLETGRLVSKPEDTKYKHGPCYEKSVKKLIELKRKAV